MRASGQGLLFPFLLLFSYGCARSPAPSSVPGITTPVAPTEPKPVDALPSWNDGEPQRAIVGFVERVTREGGPDFVSPEERIAVFDNDGTLWSEQPTYNQFTFAMDRVKALAPRHPEWEGTEPFRSILMGDMNAVAETGEQGMAQLLAVTHSGTTVEEFEWLVRDWIGAARHPKTNKLYTEMVYQPMLELLGYLRANGFKTFVVSGGGAEFMRPWTERVYGIPTERVVGSRGKMKYELRDGKAVLMRLPELDFLGDGPGKPVGIQQIIGRRPIAAFGNSDGDFEMLEWVTTGRSATFGLIVHHTDGEREWAYDRGSHVGRLERALDEAPKHGWVVVDMKRDWKHVFRFERH
jgi:phosphoglycolate phosphatase-like HAD superfamily hydrolase